MQPILEVHHLRKCFSKLEAVRDVSFQVRPGICFGLLGPNGAGKTTTMEIVEDIIAASSGEILYQGQPRGASFREEIGHPVPAHLTAQFSDRRRNPALIPQTVSAA